MEPSDFIVEVDGLGEVFISAADGGGISGCFIDCYRRGHNGTAEYDFVPLYVFGGAEAPAPRLTTGVLFPTAIRINRDGETGLFRLLYGDNATLQRKSEEDIDKDCSRSGWSDNLRRIAGCEGHLNCIQDAPDSWRVVTSSGLDVSRIAARVVGCMYKDGSLIYPGMLSEDLVAIVATFGYTIFTRSLEHT